MIIKSHIRGGYRSAAHYMNDQGQNEKTRLVELSDPSAKNLDDAFHNMWIVASGTRCRKPLHHISINPMKGERLTDKQVLRVVERCEEKYGYKMFHHQRVIVEHIKDGRQHFHVIWNRVSLFTNQTIWPGEHWKKSKQICREMERELGLKRPTPRGHGIRRKAKSVRHKKKKKNKAVRQKRKAPRRRKPKRWRIHKPLGNSPYSKPIRGRTNSLPDVMCQPGLVVPPVVVRPPVEKVTTLQQPHRPRRDWPLAAILDWEQWGHRTPQRFFKKWPELAR